MIEPKPVAGSPIESYFLANVFSLCYIRRTFGEYIPIMKIYLNRKMKKRTDGSNIGKI